MLVTGYWFICGGGGSCTVNFRNQSPDYKIQHTSDNQNNHHNNALLLRVPTSFLSNFQGMKKHYTLNRCYDQTGGVIHTKIIEVLLNLNCHSFNFTEAIPLCL
jgi:hypothetical protein